MSADGVLERRATITRLKTLVGGRVWKGTIPDEEEPARILDASGKVKPHIIVDFGAPVRTTRDRTLALGEKGQPHLLPVNVACIAGDADSAEDVMKAVFDLLVDWAPSDTADPFEAQGGYGGRRNATANTPTRFIEGLFLQAAVNQGLPTS